MQENAHDRLDGDELEFPNLTLLVIDSEQARWAADVDDWNAATLLACISEDPADWAELAAVWPRYQAGPSAEFADALPLEVADLETALGHLQADECWLVLDLQQQRIFSSPSYGDVQRDGCFGMHPHEAPPEQGHSADVQISIHLPPWWEIHNDATAAEVLQEREAEGRRPPPRRDVLWGKPLTEWLAAQLHAVSQTPQWKSSGAASDPQARYRYTLAVHRDWLLTPRDDLQGQVPRESLHGGTDWIERVIEGQRWNVVQERPLTRLPHDFSSYRHGPLGRSEVCLYFDLCRDLIHLGWQWLEEHQEESAAAAESRATSGRLATVLEKAKQAWLQAPFEGGCSPAAIIQNERDRIPQVVDEEQGHVLDCDCPLCLMMAEGLFGPTFIGFDGHHLEYDGEFAFSLWENHQEWEVEQAEFIAMAAEINARREAGRLGEGEGFEEDGFQDDDFEDDDGEEDEPLDSVWTGSFVSGELPGDPLGHLALAVRITDIVSELQRRSARQADVDRLNQAFVDYRHAGPEQRRVATEQLKEVLEHLAVLHPSLISRAADLQSKLDELLRRPTHADTGS